MGGALGLAIAAEGLVDAIATTAPSLLLPLWTRFLITLLGRWQSLTLEWNPLEPPFYFPAYKFASAHATVELQRIAKYSRDRLDQVLVPVYVAHSQRDRLVDPIVCTWIQNRVKGNVQIEWFNRSGHTMPLDVQGEEVGKAIASFFSSQAKAPHSIRLQE